MAKKISEREIVEAKSQGFLDFTQAHACLSENPYCCADAEELHKAWDEGWFEARSKDTFYQGWEAARDGASREDNPHIKGTHWPNTEALKWAKGFDHRKKGEELEKIAERDGEKLSDPFVKEVAALIRAGIIIRL